MFREYHGSAARREVPRLILSREDTRTPAELRDDPQTRLSVTIGRASRPRGLNSRQLRPLGVLTVPTGHKPAPSGMTAHGSQFGVRHERQPISRQSPARVGQYGLPEPS